MSYRRRKGSPEVQLQRWLKKHRHTLLCLGVEDQVMDCPSTFSHDFLQHGYAIRPGTTRTEKQELLRFLEEHFSLGELGWELLKELGHGKSQ